MKREISTILFALVLVLSLVGVVVSASPVEAQPPETIEVSQPTQITSDSHYERGSSVLEDSSGNYWLFWGRHASFTGNYGTGNPDDSNYDIYFTKSSTVAGLAGAGTAVTSSGDIYQGQTACAEYGGKIWVFGSRSDSIYYWTTTDGSSWTGPTDTGFDGHFFDVAVHGSNLWMSWNDTNDGYMKVVSYNGTTWGTPTNLQGSPTIAGAINRLYVDSTGDMWCYYSNGWGVTPDVYYFHKYDDTTGWNATPDYSLSNAPLPTGVHDCDPLLTEYGGSYVFVWCPWDNTNSRQWMYYRSAADMATLVGLSTDQNKMLTNGGTGSGNWMVDMWPRALVDGSHTYLFYGSERSGTGGVTRGTGNIWMYDLDWTMGNDHFDYIQPAIDAATGTTINVAAGTYRENVTIDKALTLNGVQHGVAAVGRSGDESTIDGGTTNAVSISASDVVLDGFTITIANEDATDKKCGVCIANDTSGLSNVTVKNNIIKDISDGGTDTTDNCTYGILVWGTTNGPSNINIQNNAIQNVEEYAITINDLSSNVTIDGNSITNMLAAQRTDGHIGVAIGIGGSAPGPSNVDITDNTLNTGLTGDGSTTDAGVGIGMEFAPTGVTITGNDITGNSEGIAVKSTTSPTVHFNNIYGNSIYGVHNYGTGSLDATNNWWGDDSGPEDTTGTNEVPPCTTDPSTEKNTDGTGDTVSDNVDYCPWLGEEYAPTKSTNTATGTGTTSFSPDSGALEGLTSVAEGTLPSGGKPDLVFPHGFFSFNITGITPGATVVVTITLPSPVPPGTQYWKYHASEGGWIQIPMGSNDGDNVITITLVDGGLGDDDGTADGVIVDQGGPGAAPPHHRPRPGVGGELYPVNKLAILAPWIALAVAIIAGAYIVRKHRTANR